MIRFVVGAAAFAGLVFGAHLAGDAMHIGAPPLVYHCQPGQHVTSWWVPVSSPQGRGAQGTTEYHGYRRIASCASSITVDGG